MSYDTTKTFASDRDYTFQFGEARLGNRVNPALSLQDNLKAMNMDWGTVKRPVAWQTSTGQFSTVPDRFAVIRTDNMRPLDVVSNEFHTNHNRAFATFFDELQSVGNIRVTHLREIDGGKQVVAYATLGLDNAEIVRGDAVAVMFRVSVPHTSGTSISVSVQIIRCKCTNGMCDVGGTMQWRMTHRKQFDAPASEIAKKVLAGLGAVEPRIEQLRLLAQREASRRQVNDFVYQLTMGELAMADILGIKDADSKRPTTFDLLDIAASNTMAKSRRTITFDDHNRAGQAIINAISYGAGADSAEGSWWQVLNGVTYYYDHQYGRTEESRAASGIDGEAARQKKQALDMVLRYAEVPALEQVMAAHRTR